MSTTPEIKTKEEQKKKLGFFASLLAKLGFKGAAGAGSIGTRAAGEVALGSRGLLGKLFGSAFQSGILATKTGVMAAAVLGTSVAGGVGYMFLGGSSSAPSASSGADGFNSLFSKKPKDVPVENQARPAGNGVSSSLDYFATANNGEGVKNEAPPEVIAAAEGKEAPAASAPAPVNNVVAADNNVAMTSKGTGPPAALKGGKQIGALSSSAGGGGSGASFAMKGPGVDANTALARAGNTSAFSQNRGDGRASLSRNRGSGAKAGGAFRQLGNFNAQSQGATNLRGGGSASVDGGVSSAELEGSEIGGVPATSVGTQEATPPGTPAGNQGSKAFIPDGPGKEVTPWKKDIAMAKVAMLAAAVGMFLAIIALQYYYESFVEDYNVAYAQAYAMTFTRATATCQANLVKDCTTTPPMSSACAGKFMTTVGEAESPLTTARAKVVDGVTAAEMQAIQLEARSKTAVAGGGTFTGAISGGATTQASAAKNEAQRQATMTAADTAVQASATILDAGVAAMTACVTAACTSSAATMGATSTECSNATKDQATITAAVQKARGCFSSALTQARADGLRDGTAKAGKSQSSMWLLVGAWAAIGVALAGSALAIKIGTDISKGEYNQKTIGQSLILGGALLAAGTAWTAGQVVRGGQLTGEDVEAGAAAGELKAESQGHMASFENMGMIEKVAGAAILLVGSQAMLAKPKKVECKKDQDCKKIEKKGEAFNWGYPSEQALKGMLAAKDYCDVRRDS